jgi:hypothetical protein
MKSDSKYAAKKKCLFLNEFILHACKACFNKIKLNFFIEVKKTKRSFSVGDCLAYQFGRWFCPCNKKPTNEKGKKKRVKRFSKDKMNKKTLKTWKRKKLSCLLIDGCDQFFFSLLLLLMFNIR